MEPSSSSIWNELSADDMKFLWDYLLMSHSQAVIEYQHEKTKTGINPSPDDVERLRILVPEGNAPISDIAKIKRPWGLSLEDLEMFKIPPPGNKVSEIDNSKRIVSKNPQQVHKALRLCYQWGLARDPEKSLADAYAEDTHPLHIRRTLDQSYYYMLDNTRSRDKDQVVSRYGRKMKRKQPVMMMVDQLVSIPVE
jgi:hypothetical protein